jgi:type VI secretion system protein ImpH
MAAYGWRGEASVRDWLFAEPWAFEFYQAVRLLDAMRPGQAGVAFRSAISLAFPASEVQSIESGEPPRMTVNFMGLAGLLGPLPHPDTELALERLWYRDEALRDFLDVFNHRLIELKNRIRRAHRVSLTARAPHEGRAADYLFSLFGLGHTSLRNRLAVPDRALLRYSGLLASHPRSACGLERLLADFFGTGARVRQFEGRWRIVDEDRRTVLGRSGRNRTLGQTAMAGTRYWDQAGRFHIELGPMNRGLFDDLLPTGDGYARLAGLARFYAGPEFEMGFTLVLEAAYLPPAKLGSARLGWTSFLPARISADSPVRLSTRYAENPEELPRDLHAAARPRQ